MRKNPQRLSREHGILGTMAVESMALAWFRQRMSGAAAVERVQDQELVAMSDEEAVAQSDALLSMPTNLPDPARNGWSGFVEQQTLFLRARR